MRRNLVALAVVFAGTALAVLGASPTMPAAAQSPDPAQGQEEQPLDPESHIDVVQVEGSIDPVVSDLIVSSLRRAARSGSSLVILQIDSKGALDTDPAVLRAAVRASKVPVAAWVGPSHSSARGAAAGIVLEAHVSGIAPDSRLGPLFPQRLDRPGAANPRAPEASGPAQAIAHRRLQGQAAVAAEAVDFVAPTLGDLLVSLDGYTVKTDAGEVKLSTARVVETSKGPRRTTNQPVRFYKLDAIAGVQHSLTSSAMAYLLLIVGLALIVFEFFTLGVGLAGVVGAGAVAGAFFGFSHLPAAWWAVALLGVSTLGFSIDVQAGHLGFWTGVGEAGLVAGSLGLYNGSSLLNVPLWLVILVVIGQTIFMLGGMTVAVRNRCAVPTVGREGMIGEIGEVRTDLNPEGVVLVRGAPWRARTRRGRPLPAGEPVRVVSVDRLVLEVEPGEPAPT